MMQPKALGRVELQPTDDQAAALAGLAQDAERIVRIFSDELAPDLFDSAALADELSRVARHGRQCEVRILIKNSVQLVKRAHRLGALHRRLVSSVPIRRLGYNPDHYVPNYVLIDDRGVFYIPNEEDKVSFLNRDDRALVKHLTEQFDELWQKSIPDVDLRNMPM
jgi:hypothetical protein